MQDRNMKVYYQFPLSSRWNTKLEYFFQEFVITKNLLQNLDHTIYKVKFYMPKTILADQTVREYKLIDLNRTIKEIGGRNDDINIFYRIYSIEDMDDFEETDSIKTTESLFPEISNELRSSTIISLPVTTVTNLHIEPLNVINNKRKGWINTQSNKSIKLEDSTDTDSYNDESSFSSNITSPKSTRTILTSPNNNNNNNVQTIALFPDNLPTVTSIPTAVEPEIFPTAVEPEINIVPAISLTNFIPKIFTKIEKCNCQKSKCLKLYCPCFRNDGQRCTDQCACKNCYNKEKQSLEIENHRVKEIKKRLPNNNEIFTVNNQDMVVTNNLTQILSCTCKRSECNKKYCVCYDKGIKCNATCTCINCLNGGGEGAQPLPTPL
jgi:hypothetical protein